MLIQQGDVLIKRVDSIPASAKKVSHNKLAEGEVTGHAHRAQGGQIYEENGVLYLHTDEETQVVHEEHDVVTIPKGDWQIGIVKEYDHFAEEARRVAD